MALGSSSKRFQVIDIFSNTWGINHIDGLIELYDEINAIKFEEKKKEEKISSIE